MPSDAIAIAFVLAVVVYLWIVGPVRWFLGARKGRYRPPWM